MHDERILDNEELIKEQDQEFQRRLREMILQEPLPVEILEPLFQQNNQLMPDDILEPLFRQDNQALFEEPELELDFEESDLEVSDDVESDNEVIIEDEYFIENNISRERLQELLAREQDELTIQELHEMLGK